MKKKLLLSLAILAFSLCLSAQAVFVENAPAKAKRAYKKADVAVLGQDWDVAISHLKEAIAESPNFVDALLFLGDVYFHKNQYDLAFPHYEKALALHSKVSPGTRFKYGRLLMRVNRFDEAETQFNLYLNSGSRISPEKKKEVDRFLESCAFAQEAMAKPKSFKPLNMGAMINGPDHEYLPVFSADEKLIIFSRRINLKEDFFFAEKEEDWKSAKNLGAPINGPGNEGAASLSPDGKHLFFAIKDHPEGMGSFDIFYSYNKNGKWTEPYPLPFPINTRGYDSQPSFSPDGKTLFFVSNRKGGLGDMDIWSVDLVDGQWAMEAVNLGPTINTKNAEQSPFLHSDNLSLYFSSDGHPGLGDADNFVSRRKSNLGDWETPENLGFPINTPGHEGALRINARGDKGYFSSDNIDGGYGGLDIYVFDLDPSIRPRPTSYLKARVIDYDSKAPIHKAQVSLTNLRSGNLDYSGASNEDDGSFVICLPNGNDYALAVSSPGYLFHSENFSLNIKESGKPFELIIELKKIKSEQAVVLRNVFFESGQHELLPASFIELDKLYALLVKNPSIRVELAGHTDNVGKEMENQELSQNRAEAVRRYLLEKGIEENRLLAKGYGETEPISTNDTEEGRRLNRRTEFKIISAP